MLIGSSYAELYLVQFVLILLSLLNVWRSLHYIAFSGDREALYTLPVQGDGNNQTILLLKKTFASLCCRGILSLILF